MFAEGRRLDGAEGQLGDGVGILEELVGVGLHGPGRLAVVAPAHAWLTAAMMSSAVSQSICAQHAVDAQHGRLKPLTRRRIDVEELLGQGAATDRVVAALVDDGGLGIGHDHDVVILAVDLDDVVLIGADPGLKRRRRAG